jgi:hypothetical protein
MWGGGSSFRGERHGPGRAVCASKNTSVVGSRLHQLVVQASGYAVCSSKMQHCCTVLGNGTPFWHSLQAFCCPKGLCSQECRGSRCYTATPMLCLIRQLCIWTAAVLKPACPAVTPTPSSWASSSCRLPAGNPSPPLHTAAAAWHPPRAQTPQAASPAAQHHARRHRWGPGRRPPSGVGPVVGRRLCLPAAVPLALCHKHRQGKRMHQTSQSHLHGCTVVKRGCP